MICGVPKLQLSEEVKRLASPYGDLKKVIVIPDYPTEEFTEAYHVHYGRIQSARFICIQFFNCRLSVLFNRLYILQFSF